MPRVGGSPFGETTPGEYQLFVNPSLVRSSTVKESVLGTCPVTVQTPTPTAKNHNKESGSQRTRK